MTLPAAVLGSIWTEFSVAALLMGIRTASAYISKGYRLDFWLAWISLVHDSSLSTWFLFWLPLCATLLRLES